MSLPTRLGNKQKLNWKKKSERMCSLCNIYVTTWPSPSSTFSFTLLLSISESVFFHFPVLVLLASTLMNDKSSSGFIFFSLMLFSLQFFVQLNIAVVSLHIFVCLWCIRKSGTIKNNQTRFLWILEPNNFMLDDGRIRSTLPVLFVVVIPMVFFSKYSFFSFVRIILLLKSKWNVNTHNRER